MLLVDGRRLARRSRRSRLKPLETDSSSVEETHEGSCVSLEERMRSSCDEETKV